MGHFPPFTATWSLDGPTPLVGQHLKLIEKTLESCNLHWKAYGKLQFPLKTIEKPMENCNFHWKVLQNLWKITVSIEKHWKNTWKMLVSIEIHWKTYGKLQLQFPLKSLPKSLEACNFSWLAITPQHQSLQIPVNCISNSIQCPFTLKALLSK